MQRALTKPALKPAAFAPRDKRLFSPNSEEPMFLLSLPQNSASVTVPHTASYTALNASDSDSAEDLKTSPYEL